MRPDEPVARVMTETVIVIEDDRPVSEALACLLQYPIHHLPVVRAGRLVGMLGSADLLKLEFFVPRSAADRAQYLDDRFSIGQFMRTPVQSCRAEASLGEVAELIISAGVHAVPIVDSDDHVVGIVSTTDIIRSLLHGPPRRGAPPTAGQTALLLRADPVADAAPLQRKPADSEYATAMEVARALHVEARDRKFLGKSLLYLDQRCRRLEQVLILADLFLRAGQDEQGHAALLKAILSAKRTEEQAAGLARVPLPLQ